MIGSVEGFDFRFGIEALPGPEMYVDLGNYRFLSATRKTATGNDRYLTVLVSQSAQHDFVQNIYLAGRPRGLRQTDRQSSSRTKQVPNTFDGLLERRRALSFCQIWCLKVALRL